MIASHLYSVWFCFVYLALFASLALVPACTYVEACRIRRLLEWPWLLSSCMCEAVRPTILCHQFRAALLCPRISHLAALSFLNSCIPLGTFNKLHALCGFCGDTPLVLRPLYSAHFLRFPACLANRIPLRVFCEGEVWCSVPTCSFQS